MTNLKVKYRNYARKATKDYLAFGEFKAVNNLEDGKISVIVKSDDITITDRVLRENPKSYTPEQIANDIYEKLNNERASEYHVISVFISIDKIIFPFKFLTKVDKPENKINEAINRVMFVYKPKVNENKLKQNKNFLDFSITKGENTICRRFSYIDDTITDFTEAYEILEKHFEVTENGRYNHDIIITFNVTNDINDVDYSQEFQKEFNSKFKIINVKNGIKEMLKSFKNDSEGED